MNKRRRYKQKRRASERKTERVFGWRMVGVQMSFSPSLASTLRAEADRWTKAINAGVFQ